MIEENVHQFHHVNPTKVERRRDAAPQVRHLLRRNYLISLRIPFSDEEQKQEEKEEEHDTRHTMPGGACNSRYRRQ